MGKHRLLASALAASLLAVSLAACSPEEGPGPDASAESLASGLSALDVTGTAFADSSVEAVNGMLQYLVSGMDGLKPDVTVSSIEERSATEATATLHYVWDINRSETDFSYDATVNLVRDEDKAWQVRFTSTTVHPQLKPGEHLERTASPVRRGEILGAGGAVLMADRGVWRVGIDKGVLKEKEYASSAFYLSQYLNMDIDSFTAKVLAAGPKEFVDAVTVRQDKVPANFESEIATVPGAAALPEVRTLAETGSFAEPLLGTVGTATPELIEQSGGALAAGDQAGLSGLQQQYDEQLRGFDAVTVRIVQTGGAASAPLFETPGQAGEPLQTTLSPGIQSKAGAALKDLPAASAIVAIRPSTGELLAVADGPGSKGTQTALQGEYAPGSTFTLASVLAMLRTGATATSMLSCPQEVEVDGQTFRNPDMGSSLPDRISLAGAFAQSCNTAFVDARDSVPQPDLASAAAALGLGVEADIGIPAAYGSVPETADGALHAASLVGEGEVTVSPLALATAGASVLKGERVTPVLVTGSGTPEGAEDPPPGPVTADEAETLQKMMRSAVTEGGGLLGDVPGAPVLAKSGTAGSAGGAPPGTHAWVLALQGDLAVAVFLADGAEGPAAAEGIAQAFLASLAG